MIRVGEKLRDERLKKGLTLEDVAKATKIKTQFLQAIEKGNYSELPSSAYAHGFIRNYSNFLGLSERQTLALFRREFDEEKFFKVLPEGLAKREEFSVGGFKFQQTASLILLLFFGLLLYILFQYRYAFINPPLTLSMPKEGAVITTRVVSILGKTDQNATVYVGGIPVTVDQNGSFEKIIDVFPGKTTIIVKAVNRFGKETTTERHIEVQTRLIY